MRRWEPAYSTPPSARTTRSAATARNRHGILGGAITPEVAKAIGSHLSGNAQDGRWRMPALSRRMSSR